MSNEDNNTSIGVIVARFQVAELTEGHKELLNFVLAKGHNQNVIFLGVAPTKATKNNPLDYDSRRRMLEEAYPGQFTILFQEDTPSDKEWSTELDEKIAVIANGRDVVMYGSRDSFGEHYFGKYEFCEVPQHIYCSGTDQRLLTGKIIKSSSDWRKGCIYATQNRYPTVYPTVDCAIFDDDNLEYIYMAKKQGEKRFRFVGGFADPKDQSFEITARREAQEETGLETAVLACLGSTRIDDWRYREEQDKVITTMFVMKKVFGKPEAKDDICELRKLRFSDLKAADIIPEHHGLFGKLSQWHRNYGSMMVAEIATAKRTECFENMYKERVDELFEYSNKERKAEQDTADLEKEAKASVEDRMMKRGAVNEY